MQITIDIPEGYFPHQEINVMAQQFKLYAALLMFQSEQLSRGAACEFAGVDIYAFIYECLSKTQNIRDELSCQKYRSRFSKI